MARKQERKPVDGRNRKPEVRPATTDGEQPDTWGGEGGAGSYRGGPTISPGAGPLKPPAR